MVAVHLHRRDVLVEQGSPLGLGGCLPDLVEVDVGEDLSDSLEPFGKVMGRRKSFDFGLRKRFQLCSDALLLLGEEVCGDLVGVVQLERPTRSAPSMSRSTRTGASTRPERCRTSGCRAARSASSPTSFAPMPS